MTLAFRNVGHRYGNHQVLSGVSLEARAGEILCLLGPSGSGKTTLLRLAAGLEILQEGSIDLGGAVLAMPGRALPPEKRPFGMVFQDNALFPHLTVAENIAFGLSRRPKEEQAASSRKGLPPLDFPASSRATRTRCRAASSSA